MNAKTFIANFFRQGTAESSTRLVGIFSFFGAVAMTFYIVITKRTDAGSLAANGMAYANALIALGLRKSPDAEGGSPS